MRKNFSSHIMNVFSANETSYDEIKNLMLDLAAGREMFDAEGNKIAKADAEAPDIEEAEEVLEDTDNA